MLKRIATRFWKKRGSVKSDEEFLLKNYIKSFVRFEEPTYFRKIHTLESPFLKKLYINHSLIDLIIENGDAEDQACKEKISYFVKNQLVSYDDFETLFCIFFKMNQDDHILIKEFVKPFYKMSGKDHDPDPDLKIEKMIQMIFFFFIYYFQFYMILHEFLEIKECDLKDYLYQFIHTESNQSNKYTEISYVYFHTYITKLFTIFYQTIHYIQDVTEIRYIFDIHHKEELKRKFYKMILKKKF